MKGRRQATLFSWENAAKKTLEILEAVPQAQKRQPRGYVPPQEPLEGHFGDGWAGPHLLVRRVELSRWRTMVLEGEASEHCLPMEILIRGNGTVIDEFQLASEGRFGHKTNLPEEGSDSGLVDIEIFASTHFVPRKLRLGKDTRLLSFRLQHLALTDLEGNPMTLYRGQ